MKVVFLSFVAVALVLAYEGDAARLRKRESKVAAWVPMTIRLVDIALMLLPHSDAVTAAVHDVITAAGTIPFNLDYLITSVFNLVSESINYLRGGKQDPTAQALDNLMDDLAILIIDAIHGNVNNLATDASRVVCDIQAFFGKTDCDLSPVAGAIDKLILDVQNGAKLQVVIDDSFNIAVQSVNVVASNGRVDKEVTNAMIDLINDINQLVQDCITGKTAAIAKDVGDLVKDSIDFIGVLIKM
jgi:hypothetical protein